VGGRATAAILVTVGALAATACSGGGRPALSAPPPPSTARPTDAPAADATTSGAATTPTADTSSLAPLTPIAADDRAAIEAIVAKSPPGCDPLDARQCLLPYPSDYFTVADPHTDTGLRVALPKAGMPVNVMGKAIDATEWNRNDGFSPNSTLLTYVPDLDDKSSLPSWTDLTASLRADSPVVLVDTATDKRIPLWAELDYHAQSATDRLLTIHPAIALPEDHHFVVALRNLRRRDGTPVEAGAVFRAYRDRVDTAIPAIESRRDAIEVVLAQLAAAGVPRGNLVLAWDFTAASERSLSERMLHIRDVALAALGSKAPAFTVTEVKDHPADLVAREVIGTFTVPNFLSSDGGPGQRFNAGPDGLPPRHGDVQAPFACNIPEVTAAGTEGPARIAEYGHGLFGSELEIGASSVRHMGQEHNIVFCATRWAGLSEDDVGNTVASLQDVSNFPSIPDRQQQGVLNQIFLGRLMNRPDGFASLPAFQVDGKPLIETSHLFFDGNSEGGVEGGLLAAVSPDIERAVLGVPGMNYGLLVPRSVDFDEYEAVFKPAYPDDLHRTLVLALLQMLWDRGEAGGYIQHLTSNPYPGTRAKTVLLHVALGDFQVSPLAAEIEARTIGAHAHVPIAAAGRLKEVQPMWGIDPITTYPYDGSAIVLWDSGTPDIPLANLPPRAGRDPHGDPRSDVTARQQKSDFLWVGGAVYDLCGGHPCAAAPAS
jgi:hypothetical protein